MTTYLIIAWLVCGALTSITCVFTYIKDTCQITLTDMAVMIALLIFGTIGGLLTLACSLAEHADNIILWRRK